MRRREFIAGLGSAAAALPIGAHAQKGSLPIIGWLHAQSPEAHGAFMPAFDQGLLETGFVDGRNVVTQHLWAEGHYDRRPALLADLVHRKVSVIVTDTTGGAVEAKSATRTIPIVFTAAGGDPTKFGLVESLNRPGGNVTGVAILGLDIEAKRLELMKQLVPSAGLIAALANSAGGQYGQTKMGELRSAANVLGVSAVIVNVDTPSEIASAMETVAAQKADALLVGASIQLQQARAQIIALAARHRIPALFWDSTSVAAGGLSSYGPDFVGAYHQAGLYVGRILKGEKPADLPVVQPTKFELVINLKTAKALGLTIPETLLATADEVIQ
jgi:putative ABC transport system substrate-binding protein